MKEMKLFDYFPHPRKWNWEQSLVWLAIAAAAPPLGLLILILAWRKCGEEAH